MAGCQTPVGPCNCDAVIGPHWQGAKPKTPEEREAYRRDHEEFRWRVFDVVSGEYESMTHVGMDTYAVTKDLKCWILDYLCGAAFGTYRTHKYVLEIDNDPNRRLEGGYSGSDEPAHFRDIRNFKVRFVLRIGPRQGAGLEIETEPIEAELLIMELRREFLKTLASDPNLVIRIAVEEKDTQKDIFPVEP